MSRQASLRINRDEIDGEIGRKRLTVAYGEHPDSVERIHQCVCQTRKGEGRIRRVNINAAPMSVEELMRLHDVGIGIFQRYARKPITRKLPPKFILPEPSREITAGGSTPGIFLPAPGRSPGEYADR